MESSHMLILHPTPQQEQYSNPECDGHCSNYLSCKSQHSAGGICIGILVGKQPEGEISGPATAQIVMQIPPAECWDLHLYGGPTGHSTSLVGPRDGPADVRVTRHIPHFRGFGRHALEPVRPSDPLSIQWTAAGTGDAVWDNPTSG